MSCSSGCQDIYEARSMFSVFTLGAQTLNLIAPETVDMGPHRAHLANGNAARVRIIVMLCDAFLCSSPQLP